MELGFFGLSWGRIEAARMGVARIGADRMGGARAGEFCVPARVKVGEAFAGVEGMYFVFAGVVVSGSVEPRGAALAPGVGLARGFGTMSSPSVPMQKFEYTSQNEDAFEPCISR